MAKVEFIKDKTHRFIVNRRLVSSIHQFDRDEISDPIENYFRADIDMEMTCKAMPLQYEGTVNGKFAYFRDRHGVWSFEIYDGEIFDSKIIFQKGGSSSGDDGYNSMLIAEKIILKQSLKYAKKFGGWKGEKDEKEK